MNSRVSRISELGRNESAGDLLGEFLSLGDSALHALCAVGEHQFRTVSFHQVAALNAHGFGHYDDYTVVSCGSDGSKTDTGVAAGRLDDNAVGLEYAALLSVVDHCGCNSVLYASCRIEQLQLCKDLCACLLLSLDLGHLKQGGMSDGVCNSLVNLHNKFSFSNCPNLLRWCMMIGRSIPTSPISLV